jgi:hypothetical protein
MANRADSEVPQEPADNLEAEASRGAEIRSPPEIIAPMLDVHAIDGMVDLSSALKLEKIRAAEHSVPIGSQANAPPTSGTEHP